MKKLSRIYRSKRNLFFLLIALGVFYLIFSFNITNRIDVRSPLPKSVCDLNRPRNVLSTMCDLYSQQQMLIGDLCADLCSGAGDGKFDKYGDGADQYRLIDCYNPTYNMGKDQASYLNQNDLYKTVFIYERTTAIANKDNNHNSTSMDTFDDGNGIRNRRRRRFVLKSRKKSFLDFDFRLEYDLKEKPVVEQLRLLVQYLQRVLSASFGVDLDTDVHVWMKLYSRDAKTLVDAYMKRGSNLGRKDLIYYVKLLSSASNFDNYFMKALLTNDSALMEKFLNNFIVLIMQEEYLFYKYFEQKNGSLKILGTCGNFYAVEYAETLEHKVRDMNLSQRRDLALKFLDLIQNVDSKYLFKAKSNDLNAAADEMNLNATEFYKVKFSKLNSLNVKYETVPMQICDVKLDNFGLNEQNELKLIDTDTIHPDSYLFPAKVCTTHDDCHFFDCKSYCDPSRKKCLTRRVNNNLQMLCESIFYNKLNKRDGVLSGGENEIASNVKYELMRRSKICASPGFYMNDTDIKTEASYKLFKTLRVLLKDNTLIINNN